MLKKAIWSTIVAMAVISTTTAIFGMEPDICPGINTEKDTQDFLHQLGTTAKSNAQGKQFVFQGKEWLISADSYALLNGSIPPVNEQVISQETNNDYVVLDEIHFDRKANIEQSIRCYYKATGTGRKGGKPVTINNEFYIIPLAQEGVAKVVAGGQQDVMNKTAVNASNVVEKKLVKQFTTTLGAEVHVFSNNEIAYQWDTFYQTPAYKEAEPGEQITDNFIINSSGKPQLLVRVQIKKGNSEAESRKTQVQEVNQIKSLNVSKSKVAGVIYMQKNGQESYYAGFWRDHPEYQAKQPNEKIQERFNIRKICGTMNGQNLCVVNVSDVVIRKAAKNWQLPIFDTIIHYGGAQQPLIIPNTLPGATGGTPKG